MNQALIDLAVQRGRLMERSSIQRRQLQQQLLPLDRALRATDRAVSSLKKGTDYLEKHPGAVAAAALVLLVMIRPRGVWRWGMRGFFVWRGWRKLRVELVDMGLMRGI
ncbi:MAG TPA: YqjK family protein [Accumulibacter sp.]|jgi:hypothetical protein|nr:YqjK family protein [Accumulibacter sp.]HQC79130.1 YqjK family protein [Accumulibacter sp.]